MKGLKILSFGLVLLGAIITQAQSNNFEKNLNSSTGHQEIKFVSSNGVLNETIDLSIDNPFNHSTCDKVKTLPNGMFVYRKKQKNGLVSPGIDAQEPIEELADRRYIYSDYIVSENNSELLGVAYNQTEADIHGDIDPFSRESEVHVFDGLGQNILTISSIAGDVFSLVIVGNYIAIGFGSGVGHSDVQQNTKMIFYKISTGDKIFEKVDLGLRSISHFADNIICVSQRYGYSSEITLLSTQENTMYSRLFTDVEMSKHYGYTSTGIQFYGANQIREEKFISTFELIMKL